MNSSLLDLQMLIMVFLLISGSLKQDFCVSVEIKVLPLRFCSFLCSLLLLIYVHCISSRNAHFLNNVVGVYYIFHLFSSTAKAAQRWFSSYVRIYSRGKHSQKENYSLPDAPNSEIESRKGNTWTPHFVVSIAWK